MRIGLIDIGSNSVKCNIYEYAPEARALKLLLTQSRTVGLIQYIRSGQLQEEGIAVLMQTIEAYHVLTKEMKGERVCCVATASLRTLSNGEEICRRITEIFDCEMRIIPASEEAMLGYRAASRSLDLGTKRGILIDMGGASTELTAFENGEIRHFVSLPIGCFALYLAFVSAVLPNKEERHAICARVDALLAPLSWLEEYGEALFLIGGTAKLLAKILCDETGLPYEDGVCFTEQQIDACYRSYRSPGKKKIRRIIAASADRLHTFLPGLIAYRRILKSAGAKTVTVSFSGIRDGLALSVLDDGGETR